MSQPVTNRFYQFITWQQLICGSSLKKKTHHFFFPFFSPALPNSPQQAEEQFLSKVFLWVAIIFIFWLLIAWWTDKLIAKNKTGNRIKQANPGWLWFLQFESIQEERHWKRKLWCIWNLGRDEMWDSLMCDIHGQMKLIGKWATQILKFKDWWMTLAVWYNIFPFKCQHCRTCDIKENHVFFFSFLLNIYTI